MIRYENAFANVIAMVDNSQTKIPFKIQKKKRRIEMISDYRL